MISRGAMGFVLRGVGVVYLWYSDRTFWSIVSFSFPHERVSSSPSCLGLICLLYLSHAC